VVQLGEFGRPILVGLVLGVLARWYLLRLDYRQYPSYPHGYLTHLAFGVIAAFVGAVAVPALAAREFTAVTFLALTAQQFRDIRNLERETLTRMEEDLLVPRGADYIEGIARVFEARNYMVIFVALLASTATQVSLGYPFLGLKPYASIVGVVVGAVTIFFSIKFMSGKSIGDIGVVREGKVRFDGPGLYVDDIYIMNVGLKSARKAIQEGGLGVVIEPKDDNARDTLGNLGQRQAISHDVAAVLGVKKDYATPEFTPLVRRNLENGQLGMIFVPMEPDMEALLEVVRRVPVLEATRGRAMYTRAGRKASD